MVVCSPRSGGKDGSPLLFGPGRTICVWTSSPKRRVELVRSLQPFGQPQREVVSQGSLGDLLARLLQDLKAGAYRVDEFGAQRPKE